VSDVFAGWRVGAIGAQASLDLTATDGCEQRGARGAQDGEERAQERLISCGGGVTGAA